MIQKPCRECGLIKENAAIKLDKLKKKMGQKLYIAKYGDTYDKIRAECFEPVFSEIWEWRESINQILGDL